MRQVPDEVTEANSIRHDRLTVMPLAWPVFKHRFNSCKGGIAQFSHLANGTEHSGTEMFQ